MLSKGNLWRMKTDQCYLGLGVEVGITCKWVRNFWNGKKFPALNFGDGYIALLIY